jgi:glycosyltransferase involved in cell wall biosynthesis
MARVAGCKQGIVVVKVSQGERLTMQRPEAGTAPLGERPVKLSTQPLVAVITPVYNGEAYLKATMESVQKQTYGNIVHVILDNCSTDGTAAIIEQFRNQRVKLIVARNDELVPIWENWNRALRMVPPEAAYAKILCGDDLIRSDCISRFVAVAESDQAVEVVLSHDIFFEENVHRANLPPECTVFDVIAIMRAAMNDSINWLPYHHLFIRLHDYDRDAPMFEARPIFFDAAAVFSRLRRGKFAYLHEPLLYTRWHKDSETSKFLRSGAAVPLLTRYDIFTAYGCHCWDGATYRKELERLRGRLARFILHQKLTGQHAVARELETGLGDRGVQLSLSDYVRSVLAWPAYLRWKRSWQQLKGPRIDESRFSAD